VLSAVGPWNVLYAMKVERGSNSIDLETTQRSPAWRYEPASRNQSFSYTNQVCQLRSTESYELIAGIQHRSAPRLYLEDPSRRDKERKKRGGPMRPARIPSVQP
jgi:7,8-dihydro-6-hydroxymethylpterin-pyrophosphokinase